MTNKMMEITCPECEGEGIVWVLDWLYYDGAHDEHEEICDECNGEGTVIVDAEDYYANHIDETPEGFWDEEDEMSEMSDTFKLVNAMELAKEARVGMELTYFDVIELLGELESLKDYIAELEEIDRMRSESVSTLNQANANNEDEIELLEKRIAELEEKQRWIPVSERLPQIGMRVLFYNNFTKNIHKGWFSCDKWTSDIGVFYNGDNLKRITHWMPLPESPNDTQIDALVYGKDSKPLPCPFCGAMEE